MPRLIVALESQLVVIEGSDNDWNIVTKVPGIKPECVAVDPFSPSIAYAAGYGRGLWRTDDAGLNWRPSWEAVDNKFTTSVAVSPIEKKCGFSVVYAGTEPSALYRSEDGGKNWL